MSTPRWQKARILKSRLFPHMIGKVVWVENAMPTLTGYTEVLTHNDVPAALTLYSALEDDQGYSMVFALDYLELLAEFTDTASAVPFAVWSDPTWNWSL